MSCHQQQGENEARYHTSNAKRQCTLRPGECDCREDRTERYKAATKNTEAQQCDCILSRFGDSITLGFFGNLWRAAAPRCRPKRADADLPSMPQPPSRIRPMICTAMTFTMVADGKIMA